MSAPEWRFVHSVEATVPSSSAWRFWTDVSNWERVEGESVEWIRLDGPFAEGAVGATKMRGQPPRRWTIAKLDPGVAATVEVALDGAVLSIETRFEAPAAERTVITQSMELSGSKAAEYAPGMAIFEQGAPQGLAKLAAAMEASIDNEPGQ